MADEEWDFDDPRWITAAATATPPSASELSYTEKRKRDIARGLDKGRVTKKSRIQDEEDRREEGLRTNLIAQDAMAGGASKALKMMKGMGFVPGEALGARRPSPEIDSGSFGSGGLGGIGSTSRGGMGSGIGSSGTSSRGDSPAPPTVGKPRTEPITFQMRDRRTGLGIPSAPKKSTPFPTPESEAAKAAAPLPDVNLYLERNRGQFDDRKAQGVLHALRKTLEELDRRNGIEDSVMWKAPEDAFILERKARARRAYLGGDVDPDADFGVDVEGERKDEDDRRRRGNLGYEKGLSNVVVDAEDEEGVETEQAILDRQEEEEWLSFDVRVRLALTLQYLRKTYHYCFWCGCQYEDAADMANCPGEDEKDHE